MCKTKRLILVVTTRHTGHTSGCGGVDGEDSCTTHLLCRRHTRSIVLDSYSASHIYRRHKHVHDFACLNWWSTTPVLVVALLVCILMYSPTKHLSHTASIPWPNVHVPICIPLARSRPRLTPPTPFCIRWPTWR